jgi:hypothetical protein
LEIAAALRLFSELARRKALDDYTRERLKSLVVRSPDDQGELLAALPHGVVAATGATTLAPGRVSGATINVHDLEIGS